MAAHDLTPTEDSTSARWTPWGGLVLSLILPVVLGVVAGVLGWGGVIERLEVEARQRAGEHMARLEATLLEHLAVVRNRTGAILSVRREPGAAGEPEQLGAPLVRAPEAGEPPNGALDPASLTLCEIAAATERLGEAAEALALFDRAAAMAPPAKWQAVHRLARARAEVRTRLAAGSAGPASFQPLIELMEAESNVAWVDQVSLPALAAVSGLRLANEAEAPVVAARFRNALWTARVPIDPGTLSAWLRQDVFEAQAPVCQQFARLVAAADLVAWRELPEGEQESTLIDLPAGSPVRGHVLVTRKRLTVLSPSALVDEMRTATKFAGRIAQADWLVAPSPADVERALAYSNRWSVALVPAVVLPSARLRALRWWLVGAAVLALLVGQSLVWRSVWREAELVSLRSDFVDLVGHELRTPLSVLTAKAEMLAHGDVPDGKEAEYQQSVYRAALRLGEQVNQVLDFSRLEKGQQPLDLRGVSTRLVVAKALRRTRDALTWAGQRVHLDVPRELPPIRADVDLVVQALGNLLHNAVRHAPGARIELRATVQGDVTKLAVLDDGPGLGSVEPAQLFVAFRRGEQRASPGTGLGLAIVARSMQAMGGQVRAWNRTEASGSAFELTLQNHPSQQTNPGKQANTGEGDRL